MAKKTVLKGLLGTYGLMTTEFARAFDSDSEEERPSGQRYEDAEIIQQQEPIIDQNEPTDAPKKIQI
jgi:recombinational DNA repair protein RecT